MEVLVGTYLSGIVNENDITYIGGLHPILKSMYGIDILRYFYPKDTNMINFRNKSFIVKDYCTIISTNEASNIAYYEDDFYKGSPAITKNKFGIGTSYFIGMRSNQDFLNEFYDSIVKDLHLSEVKDFVCEEGISIQIRENDIFKYYFVMNFTEECKNIEINNVYFDLISKKNISGLNTINPYGVYIFKKEK